MQLPLEVDQNNGADLVSRKHASFSAVVIYDQVDQNNDISHDLSDIHLNSFFTGTYIRSVISSQLVW